MENTRPKLSFVRKSSPVAILQNALICGTNNFHFHKLNVPDLVYVPTVSAELTQATSTGCRFLILGKSPRYLPERPSLTAGVAYFRPKV